jgi:hypothetical protein
LLLSLAALNMPRTMVLCVGGDGHVAVEPAGHDHRASCSHTPDRSPTDPDAGEHSHIGPACCRPCVDIPIPIGAGGDRIVSQKSKSTGAHAVSLQPAIQTPDALEASRTTVLLSFWLLSFHGPPPRCTILQV